MSPTPNNALALAQSKRADAIRNVVVRTLPFRNKPVAAPLPTEPDMRRLAALIQDEIRAEAKVAFHKAKKRDDLYEHAYAKLVRIRDLIQAGMHPTYKRTQSEQVDPRWTRADYTALSKMFRT